MTKRVYGIDSMRYLAVVAVVFIHCFPAGGTVKTIVDQLARFAVPFFFITSGYFLSLKLAKEDTAAVYLNYLKKILFLYLGWNLIYLLDFDPVLIAKEGYSSSILSRIDGFLKSGPELIIFRGIKYHLWFFMSLSFTVLVFFFFRLRNLYLFLGAGILLYIIGVLSYAYRFTPIGFTLPRLHPQFEPFNPRDFIFFAAFPFGLGLLTGVKKIKTSSWVALLIFCGGVVMHFAEVWYLRKYSIDILIDFAFSTFLMGYGAFLFANSDPRVLENQFLAKLGTLSLGIYGSHLLFENKLDFIKNVCNPGIWNYLFPVLVVLLATLLTFIMKKIPGLNRLV